MREDALLTLDIKEQTWKWTPGDRAVKLVRKLNGLPLSEMRLVVGWFVPPGESGSTRPKRGAFVLAGPEHRNLIRGVMVCSIPGLDWSDAWTGLTRMPETHPLPSSEPTPHRAGPVK